MPLNNLTDIYISIEMKVESGGVHIKIVTLVWLARFFLSFAALLLCCQRLFIDVVAAIVVPIPMCLIVNPSSGSEIPHTSHVSIFFFSPPFSSSSSSFIPLLLDFFFTLSPSFFKLRFIHRLAHTIKFYTKYNECQTLTHSLG